MLFHITQTHAPQDCPLGAGGVETLYNPAAAGVRLRRMYGAYAEHAVYYVVEAEGLDPVNQFLVPGFKRCSTTITPVVEEPIER